VTGRFPRGCRKRGTKKQRPAGDVPAGFPHAWDVTEKKIQAILEKGSSGFNLRLLVPPFFRAYNDSGKAEEQAEPPRPSG
jgi:hypothetical protein